MVWALGGTPSSAASVGASSGSIVTSATRYERRSPAAIAARRADPHHGAIGCLFGPIDIEHLQRQAPGRVEAVGIERRLQRIARRVDEAVADLLAIGFHPFIDRRLVEAEAVEQASGPQREQRLAAIGGRQPVDPAPLQRHEGAVVDRAGGFVDADHVAADVEQRQIEFLADLQNARDQLAQIRIGLLAVEIAPEDRSNLAAARTFILRRGQNRQQHKRLVRQRLGLPVDHETRRPEEPDFDLSRFG
jgi:hypothetical protein